MKSVLVIDTPTRCDECPLCYDSWFCIITDIDIEKIYDDIDLEYTCPIPSWCPLRPLPQKKEPKNMNEYCWNYADRPKKQKDLLAHSLDVENAEIIGWNACLDAITGETDESSTRN